MLVRNLSGNDRKQSNCWKRKKENDDESGLESDSVCVCARIGRVSWTGLLFGSWCHAMFDKHSCPHWPCSCPQLLLYF